MSQNAPSGPVSRDAPPGPPAILGPFVPRPTDIFIASYPRSGTTWLQMLVRCLVTNGDMSFDHLSRVVPFFERARRSGRSLEELPSPRVMKTHLLCRHIKLNPGRCIYIARDGRDVLVSYFHFHRTFLGSTESFEDFFDKFICGDVLYGSWFRHVADWKAHATGSHTLFLTYERLSADFDSTLHQIAAFLGLTIGAKTSRMVWEQCRFSSMKAVEQKFDPVIERALEAGEVPRGAAELSGEGSFLRRGAVGSWTTMLTPPQKKRFEQAAGELLPIWTA